MIDRQALRRKLRHIPTSVTVVTTLRGTSPTGCTVGSVVSASLEPPKVVFFAMAESRTLSAIEVSQTFTVNVLARDQAWIADAFANSVPEERFDRVGWTRGYHGNPILDGAVAVFECDVTSIVGVGDHQMVIGDVQRAEERRPAIEPLVFSQGRLRTAMVESGLWPGVNAINQDATAATGI